MYIARKYRKSNIVEYVLYMWHIEELIRSMNLDMKLIEDGIIRSFPMNGKAKGELRTWYETLVKTMQGERIKQKGHLSELTELVTELTFLHQSLLTVYQDKAYQKLVAEAQPNLDALKLKTQGEARSEVEAALNGLFGVLVLKLKKREVSEATQDAVQSISKMMAHLAKQYNAMKEGSLALPRVMEN
ncbi:MAG: DUF4924 family protein [Flavobacteriales bacterium]|jgi:hypothetical protein|nr:DUF4924 family protein [Flavobacteriales bacterium]MBT3963484.1 DUF4924 family protein [Flavobacteriales bacterium]MBT4704751.1 DUF4924 family protein [Flavobacteriales bacterium]MBT4931666.1 DUF4924 family protein [Flavobacteriales bacterium]MBT5133632.1 DUF4924 family protein [Flavobacteriales bacterium]